MKISVVVTVVDGGAALVRCLEGLSRQIGGPELDVIVPWDDSLTGMDDIAGRFPTFQFLPMGSVATERPKCGAAGQHELFDRRRSAGLGIATGDLVAIVEDRGVPRSNWSREIEKAHATFPHAVIGGAVENGVDRALNWAVYFCDFGRYGLPFEAGPREYVTDVNVCYKREALDSTRDLWAERYHETIVHWALVERGETLFLTPEPVVEQVRDDVTFRSLLPERLHWGRLFAYTRVKASSPFKRMMWLGTVPLTPAVVFARHALMQLEKGRRVSRFIRAAPAVAALVTVWCAGETLGYLTAKP